VSAQLKAVADRNACCGYGVCSEICPQVFQRDDDGHVVVAMEIVPEELAERAKEAAAGCPQNALEIVEV
jgi:ferredoxin